MQTDERAAETVQANGRVAGRFVSQNVDNISKRALSADEISLLFKGLKFSLGLPTGLMGGQI